MGRSEGKILFPFKFIFDEILALEIAGRGAIAGSRFGSESTIVCAVTFCEARVVIRAAGDELRALVGDSREL